MPPARRFSKARWTRDAAYRADYVQDLIDDLAESLETLGWSVAVAPTWRGETDRAAEGLLEQFDSDEQIRLRIDAQSRVIRLSRVERKGGDEAWHFELPLTTPAADIAQHVRTR